MPGEVSAQGGSSTASPGLHTSPRMVRKAKSCCRTGTIRAEIPDAMTSYLPFAEGRTLIVVMGANINVEASFLPSQCAAVIMRLPLGLFTMLAVQNGC
jgi:hypothetical protein